MIKEKPIMWNKITRYAGFTLCLLLLVALLSGQAIQAGSVSEAGESGVAAAVPHLITSTTIATAIPRAATVTVELCAKAGTVTMPDAAVVDIWGYALKPSGVPCSDSSVVAGLPGPVLEANVGDTLNITLYNELSEASSLVVPGQPGAPDLTGITGGSSTTYSFVAGEPGTFLYESGVNPERQVPMGLYGALVVHAAPGMAYGTAASAYDAAAVLVLSELDPAFNADPGGFDLLDYAPKYWLINGKAYPDTATLTANPDERLLLRYVNAGLIHHSMSLLGLYQTIIGEDGYAESYPYDLMVPSIPSGQTLDAIVTIPAGAAGKQFPLYNRHMALTNVASFPGGMMTYLEVQGFLNFNDYTMTPYDNQDTACGSGAAIEDGGATLHLTGNCWKKIDFAYTITPNTIVEFDFQSGTEGEVHGLGFDTDNDIDNPIQTFQLYGTQTWGLTNFNNYAGETPKHYTIPVGQFYTGSRLYMTFANDADAGPLGESIFSHIQVYEGTPLMLTVNGTDYAVASYGGSQDGGATVAIEDGGLTLRIVGNGWKKVAIPYTITASTILEFDFTSSAEGEVHGIGFDVDDTIDNPIRIFQLYGTQVYGNQSYNNYVSGSGTVHYTILVGTVYTGSFLYLTFTNDHDVASPNGESVFSNITIHE